MAVTSTSARADDRPRWHPRIRTLLLLLVLASALPIGTLAVWLAGRALEEASDRARGSVLSTARLVAAGIEQEHERTRRVLQRLASLPEVQALDVPASRRLFREYIALHPELTNMALADASGRIVLTLLPAPSVSSLDASSLEGFRALLGGEDFSVSGPLVGQISGRWALLLAHAIRDDRGRLIGAIGAPMDAVRGMGIFERVELPAGGVLAVVGRNGVVIAHSTDPSRWVGRDARDEAIVARALSAREGTAEIDDADGVRRLYGFVEVPAVGWRVYVGTPAAALLRSLDTLAARAGIISLVMLVLAALTSTFLARHIARPITALARAATRVRAGDVGAQVPMEGPAEVATVAREFNAMTETRARTEREREDLLAREREARTRAETAEQEIRAMLDRVEDGYVSLDRDWRYTHVNRRTGEMFGRRPEDLLGKHIWTEFPEGVGQPFQRAYEQAFRDQKPCTLEAHFAPWDRWFENRIYPHPNGVDIFFTEITERKHAEAARAEAEARLRLAVEAARVGLWDWDLRTQEVRYSPEWKAQLGYVPHELPDRFEEWERRVHPDDLAPTMAKVRDYTGNPVGRYEVEFRMRHRDGSWRWILTQGNVVRDDKGAVVRFVGSHIDITDRRRADDERTELAARMRRNEMLAALGALVGGVAHEVRTPLFGITATLDAMQARLGERPETAKYVTILRTEAGRLERLMRDLLDYGRPPRPESAPFTILDAIEQALRARAPEGANGEPGIELRLAADLSVLHGDVEAVVRALLNLIQNAVQHTPAEGTVIIEAFEEQNSRGTRLVCIVRDTGPGFREADLPRVMDPFYSLRKGGTGLGLPIVKRVVEDHGGHVSAGNDPRGGAVVRIEFPVLRGAERAEVS